MRYSPRFPGRRSLGHDAAVRPKAAPGRLALALFVRCGQVRFTTGKFGLTIRAKILIFGAFFREGIAGHQPRLLAWSGPATTGTLHVAHRESGAPRAKHIFLHS